MQTVFISALTAAAVTLLIEYLAKPHLEARKDRIVESRRARRELMSRIDLAAQHDVPTIGTLEPAGFGKPFVEAVEDFLAVVQEIETDFKRTAPSLDPFRRKITERLVGELGTERRTTGYFLHMYKESFRDDPRDRGGPKEQLSLRIGAMLVGILVLLRELSPRMRRPWRSLFKALLKPSRSSPRYEEESSRQAESQHFL